MQKNKHYLFLKRAFDLAHLARGKNSPNPKVGAVISFKGQVIGEGYHEKYGENHAEINAIESVQDKELLKDSIISVSLEPCFHKGKTPPCVRAIIKNNFKEVAVSTNDINPLTAGQSIALLKENGHQVHDEILTEEGQELIRHFSVNMRLKRPYIILKYAVSSDGFIGQKGKQVWLSNTFSKRLVHLWRSKLDAILVGGNTVRIDNPRLSTRYFEQYHPTRIVLSNSGSLPSSAHIFDGKISTIIATCKSHVYYENAETWQLDSNPNYLQSLMEQLLAKKNIGTILIEGGASTLQSFIDAGLWDEARIIKTSKVLGHGIAQPVLPKDVLLADSVKMGGDQVIRVLSV